MWRAPAGRDCHESPLHCAPAGFAQWKALVQLLLSCEQAPLTDQQALFVEFLKALQAQLECSLQEEVRGWLTSKPV